MQLEGEVLGGGALCQLHQAEPPLGIPLPAWLRDSWSRSGCGGSKQSRCGPRPPHLRRSPPRVEVHSGLRLLYRPAVLLQLLQLRGQAFSSVTKALTSARRRISQRRGSQLSIPLAACSSHLRPPSGACSQPPSLPSAWCPVESSLQSSTDIRRAGSQLHASPWPQPPLSLLNARQGSEPGKDESPAVVGGWVSGFSGTNKQPSVTS
ncbi:unnamed protein product [Rangifer tarandus platyrhynchus]|uniref:Uncharacterized protein n=1 Tax=Rangifer tarandus platyrhynchus TaxID=3082113 RepID=A0AC59Y7E4_RANTA